MKRILFLGVFLLVANFVSRAAPSTATSAIQAGTATSAMDSPKLAGKQKAQPAVGTANVSLNSQKLRVKTTGGGHYIGESYGGGKVFWVDASGQHGLIAATADQSTGIRWCNKQPYPTTGATNDGVYSGKINTELIISKQGLGYYAARVCDNYGITVNNVFYDDWYLPSKYELNLLYLQKSVVGDFAGTYWSSTETSYGVDVWVQRFSGLSFGLQFETNKDWTLSVRAVRAF